MEGLGPVALLGYMVVISKAIESRDQWESQIGRDNTATNLISLAAPNFNSKCGERLLRKRLS
jgi:hypothetical protein